MVLDLNSIKMSQTLYSVFLLYFPKICCILKQKKPSTFVDGLNKLGDI